MPWSEARGRFYPTLLDQPERFWAKVDKRDAGECWPWMGHREPAGYGRAGKGNRAHRIAYMLTHGAIPDGHDVRHACDNPPCCNPAHLSTGTRSENAQDAVERGRHYTPFTAAERKRHRAPAGGPFIPGAAP